MGSVSMVDGHIDEPKKTTNYDRIRNMSVEEMALRILEKDSNFSCEKFCAYTKDGKCDKFRGDGKGSCQMGIKQWLESEVDTE